MSVFDDEIARLYVQDGVSDAQIDAEAARYGPLAEDLRALVDLTIRSRAGDDEVAQVRDLLDQARRTLAADAEDHPFGVRWGASGRRRSWGNAAVGLRNAIAPPLHIEHDESGRVWADFFLHAGYEGPAGMTHGGVSALILDQMLGSCAQLGGHPGMTGTLSLRYRRPAPLGRLRAEATIDRTEGVKTFVVGTIESDGEVCVEAEGVFILPRWARGTEPDAPTTPGGADGTDVWPSARDEETIDTAATRQGGPDDD